MKYLWEDSSALVGNLGNVPTISVDGVGHLRLDQSRPFFARLFDFKDVPRCANEFQDGQWKNEVSDFHPLTFVVVFMFCICPEMNCKTDGKMRFHATSRLSWGGFANASSGRQACGIDAKFNREVKKSLAQKYSIEKLKRVRLQKP